MSHSRTVPSMDPASTPPPSVAPAVSRRRRQSPPPPVAAAVSRRTSVPPPPVPPPDSTPREVSTPLDSDSRDRQDDSKSRGAGRARAGASPVMSRLSSRGDTSTQRIVLLCSAVTVAFPPRTSCISSRPGACPSPAARSPSHSAPPHSAPRQLHAGRLPLAGQLRVGPALLPRPRHADPAPALRALRVGSGPRRRTAQQAVTAVVQVRRGQEAHLVRLALVHLPHSC